MVMASSASIAPGLVKFHAPTPCDGLSWMLLSRRNSATWYGGSSMLLKLVHVLLPRPPGKPLTATETLPRLPPLPATAPAVAVIGCGAIARSAHVPALALRDAVRQRTVLVDQDIGRASALAREFGIATTAVDYRDVLSTVQGAVIALPHHLHFPVALDCLRAGVHVLCEKPLATTAAEAAQLVAASKRARVGLAVN